jgi:predicted DNA binding CopG/RHH family protein
MEKRKMRVKLDSQERKIEEAAATYRPVSKRKLQKVEALIARARKSRHVNIRLSENVLTQLKERSQVEGLPYQTLISSILHKYVNNRLVDEDAIRKSLRLLQMGRFSVK